MAEILASVSEGGAESLPFPSRQLAELMLAIETGLALEQLVSPDALGGPGLPVLITLTGWFAAPPVTAGPVATGEQR